MEERSLPCPGCADGTRLVLWPPPSASPYRPTPAASVQVQACQVCAGVWVDTETLRGIIDGAAQAATPSTNAAVRRKTMPPGLATRNVTYRRCPVCKQSMLRRNFGSISGIVVDVCTRHGTFFDYGELPEVVDFVRSGGLTLAKQHSDAENARDARHRARRDGTRGPGMGPAWLEEDLRDPASDELLRRMAVFVRNMFR